MKEEKYLETVLQVLQEKIQMLYAKIQGNNEDITRMQEYFWENYSEFDEYGYEIYDNSNALQSRVKEQEVYAKERFRYEKMLDSPYFGRVDFCYEGEREPERYYIGIANLAKGRAADPYVFDWRAPVAGLFYDYDKGPAEFAAPVGKITGEITRKRQYKIKNGKLVYVLENDMNIDDEILQQALSEHADASLKSIVTTIQKEQNQIIRDTSHRILAVQGCAGSGKTSVALHRMAYLLYHNRKNLSAAQILILSPNSIFADYISRILPELGEENIQEMTLDDFAYRELQEYGEAEDRYDEIEKMLQGAYNYSKEARCKQTKSYVEELNGFVLSLEWELMNFKDFRYKKMEIQESEIIELFYEKMTDVPILSRMEKIAEYFIDAQETLRNKNMSEEEKQEIQERFYQMYETQNVMELYQQFLRETGRETIDLTEGILPYEDVYPLLYLKYSILEPPKRREVKHLVIDEMQDYSYLQYLLIEKMFHCPMTILGDKVQTMAEENQDVLKFLPGIFGKDVHCVYLNKSYRSTTEISEFANALVEDKDIQTIQRHGEAPRIHSDADADAMYQRMVRDIQEETDADTLAVLCLDAKAAKETAQRLGEQQLEVSLFTKDSMRFAKGICVMPFYLAKGLEFDAVYVPDLQNYTTPLHKQALYINATRALHILRLYQIQER